MQKRIPVDEEKRNIHMQLPTWLVKETDSLAREKGLTRTTITSLALQQYIRVEKMKK